MSIAPFQCLWNRHTKKGKNPNFCVHESSTEKEPPKKLELSLLRRHIQKPNKRFFAAPTFQKQIELSNWKTACFPNTLLKTRFFRGIHAFRLSNTLWAKNLMKFHHDVSFNYLSWLEVFGLQKPHRWIFFAPKNFSGNFLDIAFDSVFQKCKRGPQQIHVPPMSIFSITSPFLTRSFFVRC